MQDSTETNDIPIISASTIATIGSPASWPHPRHAPRPPDAAPQRPSRRNRRVGPRNGIKKMLDDNRYCGDILTQIAAVESALQSFGYIILQDHLETCVVEEIQNGNTEILEEAIDLIKKLK